VRILKISVDLRDLSRRLFQTANHLWTNTALRLNQYAQPVLAPIALRRMEAKFDLVHRELAKTLAGRPIKSEEQQVKLIPRYLLERLHALIDAVDWLRCQEIGGGAERNSRTAEWTA